MLQLRLLSHRICASTRSPPTSHHPTKTRARLYPNFLQIFSVERILTMSKFQKVYFLALFGEYERRKTIAKKIIFVKFAETYRQRAW